MSCLVCHRGECTFPNRHKCADSEAHHAFVCSSAKSDRKIGGVNLTSKDLSVYSVENTLRVLEDLNIDPQDFSETLGRDVFSQVNDCNGGYDSTSESDSDISGAGQTWKTGGVCPSKVNICVGLDICIECFGLSCEGQCTEDRASQAETADVIVVEQPTRSETASASAGDSESKESAVRVEADRIVLDEGNGIVLYDDSDYYNGDHDNMLEDSESIECIPNLSEDMGEDVNSLINVCFQTHPPTQGQGDQISHLPMLTIRMATNADFNGCEGVDDSDFCGQVSYDGYQGQGNLGFDLVTMGITSVPTPAESTYGTGQVVGDMCRMMYICQMILVSPHMRRGKSLIHLMRYIFLMDHMILNKGLGECLGDQLDIPTQPFHCVILMGLLTGIHKGEQIFLTVTFQTIPL